MSDDHTTACLSSTSFVAAVDAWAQQHELWPKQGPVLVGVSGGVDSMVLLHVVHALFAHKNVRRESGSETGPHVIAAHVNYGLRPGAEEDEALVRSTCAALTPRVPLAVLHANLHLADGGKNTSVQESARDARYKFFAAEAEACRARVVAVGHHRQDQAETLLLRLFRGAGPEALSGMHPKRPLTRTSDTQLIRPLLNLDVESIQTFAARHDIPWREDPSNTSGPYARASVRSAILPSIEAAFPGATGRIAHAATLLRGVTETTLRPERLKWQSRVVSAWRERKDDGGWEAGQDLAASRLAQVLLDADVLKSAPPVWRERVILDGVRAVVPDAPQTTGMARSVADLLEAQTGRHVDIGSGIVWRERDGLRVLSSRSQPFEPVSLDPGSWAKTPDGAVAVRVFRPEGNAMDQLQPKESSPNPNTALLDAGAMLQGIGGTNPDSVEAVCKGLASGWVIRRWQEGDRFQPLGMEGTKTVADVLTDAHVPPHIRERVLVLAGPTGIAWIVGSRINHRFRLTPSTRHVVELTRQERPAAPDSTLSAFSDRENRAAT